MALDWIKMQVDLYRNPKVCVIADLLMGPGSDLSRYVNQNTQRDMSVTRNVTRNAVVGALVSVWGILRHRGKRDNDDLVVDGCTLAVIDDLSDIPGFGAAMASVGWIAEKDDGFVLPRFFEEMNADPEGDRKEKERKRQKRFRDRKREKEEAERNVTSNVTVTSESNAREEKSNSNSKPPISPPRGASSVTFARFVEDCKAKGEKLIGNYEPLFAYTESIKLPEDFTNLAWYEFRRRFGPGGTDEKKKYTDWRRAFRNYVEKNYLKLWFVNAAGGYELTTAGKQAQLANAERAAA